MTAPRDELERELGGPFTALYLLPEPQCADLLDMIRTAPDRERSAMDAAVEAKLATLPRGTRAAARVMAYGWKRTVRLRFSRAERP
ncbi:hypothetical protein ACFVUS_08910 [Nocardia sp. NPDC058058]|uniref:hypothetical protein n=1 Tax=Nocardia sp. NPDC058058 TaxID=3346317 RepID=UPI0036DD2E91